MRTSNKVIGGGVGRAGASSTLSTRPLSPINPRKSPLALPDSDTNKSLTILSTCLLPALAKFGNFTAAVLLSCIFSLRGNKAGGLEWDRGGRKSVLNVGVNRDDG